MRQILRSVTHNSRYNYFILKNKFELILFLLRMISKMTHKITPPKLGHRNHLIEVILEEEGNAQKKIKAFYVKGQTLYPSNTQI